MTGAAVSTVAATGTNELWHVVAQLALRVSPPGVDRACRTQRQRVESPGGDRHNPCERDGAAHGER